MSKQTANKQQTLNPEVEARRLYLITELKRLLKEKQTNSKPIANKKQKGTK